MLLDCGPCFLSIMILGCFTSCSCEYDVTLDGAKMQGIKLYCEAGPASLKNVRQ